MSDLGKKVLINIATSLARDNLPGLVSNLTSNATNKFERKINWYLRAQKGFTLFILNEDMNDIIKILKLLEHSSVLIDGVSGTVTRKIKNKNGDFLELCYPI